MTEQIALALRGGPADGDRRLVEISQSGWPPPERALFPDCVGGYYQRVRYSRLTEPSEFIMRGAEYEWVDATERESA